MKNVMFEPKIKINIGIIITDGKKILFGYVPEKDEFDILKVPFTDYKDTIMETLLYELKEMFIDIKEEQLQSLGYFNYTPFEDLDMFIYPMENLLNEKKLNFNYVDLDGKHYNNYIYIPFEELKSKINIYLYNLLKKIFKFD